MVPLQFLKFLFVYIRAVILSVSITSFLIYKGFIIFYTTGIKRLADKEEIRPVNAEDKKPADKEKISPADIEGLVDIKILANIKNLVVIYYIY